MPAPLNVALFAFDGMQILDITGPAAVFAAANDAAGRAVYRVHLLSAHGGAVHSNSAVAVLAQPLHSLAPALVDTLLIAGGGLAQLADSVTAHAVGDWIRAATVACRRYGSICTGVFALAQLGLIDGKRVTTHWSACAALAGTCPAAQVDASALFVEDGRLWTSAGVTTGIDMSLEMVARDLGQAVANGIAQRLVLDVRRPGYQSQTSPVLKAQAAAEPGMIALFDWIAAHLGESLDVPRLAARMAMSERTFHRKFTACAGATPARFIERLRLDRALQLLQAGVALKQVAASVGYPGAAQLTVAFERHYGRSPSTFQVVAEVPAALTAS